jgi:hypothetical protein
MFASIRVRGNIQAYQDCLNLIPAPRTEADILNDFEKLGYVRIKRLNDKMEFLHMFKVRTFYINLETKELDFLSGTHLGLQEHKFLNELFNLWGWL